MHGDFGSHRSLYVRTSHTCMTASLAQQQDTVRARAIQQYDPFIECRISLARLWWSATRLRALPCKTNLYKVCSTTTSDTNRQNMRSSAVPSAPISAECLQQNPTACAHWGPGSWKPNSCQSGYLIANPCRQLYNCNCKLASLDRYLLIDQRTWCWHCQWQIPKQHQKTAVMQTWTFLFEQHGSKF